MKKFLLKYQWLIATAGAAALLTAVFTKNPLKTAVQNTLTDMNNEKQVLTLHPAARNPARKFINEAEKAGINLKITSAYRSIAEQNRLYQQGIDNPADKVTNAKGGQSYHNFSLAIDVVEIRNGKAIYKDEHGAKWPQIAAIGKAAGFEWGGDFKNFVDRPHFQLKTGLTLAQLQTRHATGQTENGYVVLT